MKKKYKVIRCDACISRRVEQTSGLASVSIKSQLPESTTLFRDEINYHREGGITGLLCTGLRCKQVGEPHYHEPIIMMIII